MKTINDPSSNGQGYALHTNVEDDDILFAELFAIAIARLQVSVAEIALWTSMHRSFLYKILRGETLPSPKALCRLTFFMGMSAEDAFISVTPISAIISGEKDKMDMLQLKLKLRKKLESLEKLTPKDRINFVAMARRVQQEKAIRIK